MRSFVGAVIVAVSLTWPARSNATPVTLNFGGNVNLSVFGASASSTFDASVTWDTTAVPISDDGIVGHYAVSGMTFRINGVSYSGAIAPAPTSFMAVTNNGGSFDQLQFVLFFSPNIALGGPSDAIITGFNGAFTGPVSMFSSTSPPSDLTFLSALAPAPLSYSTFSGRFLSGQQLPVSSVGSIASPFEPGPVPEPASLLLVGSGMTGLVLRVARRRRRATDIGGDRATPSASDPL